MNKLFALIAVCIASNAVAQVPSNAPVNSAVGTDLVEFVSVENMPLPIPNGELERMSKNALGRAADGFSSVEKSPEAVRGFFQNMNTVKTHVANQKTANAAQKPSPSGAPEIHKDLSTLKLAFKTAAFHRGTLIGAAPSGTLMENAWTGVERFFHIDGTGDVRLTEFDLAASKGKFYMIKDAVNARVNGKPAISKVLADENGQTIEEVLWVNGNKLFILTFGPDIVPGSKQKVVPQVSAHSLSQELQ